MSFNLFWRCDDCEAEASSKGNTREFEFMASQFRAHMAKLNHAGEFYSAREVKVSQADAEAVLYPNGKAVA